MAPQIARLTTTGILIILTGLIFLAEIQLEFGLATWLPYFLLAIPVSRLYSQRIFLLIVGGWSLLIMAKLLTSLPSDDLTTELFNRTLGIICLWITAYLLSQHRELGRLRTEDEQRARTMLDDAFDAVITIDARSIITTWNTQAEKTFGFSSGEALGTLLSDLITPPAFRDAHLTGLQKFLAKEEGPILGRRIEVTALHKEGREFPIELTVMPIRQEQSISFCAFARDITERKELESTLRRPHDEAESVLPHSPSTAEKQKRHVLLAEDSVESQELMRFYFQGTPYAVKVVSDGEQAVAAFQTGRFDIVLIDFQMPGMDGFTATRMIRAWESLHQKPATPILALTATALHDAEEQSLAAGCSGILTKPITKAQLFAALGQYGSPAHAAATVSKEAESSSDTAARIEEEIQRRRPQFLENRHRDMDLMRQAAADQDYETIRTMGHRIKGLAGSYRFPDIGTVGHQLEQAARARDIKTIQNEIDHLAMLLAQLHKAA